MQIEHVLRGRSFRDTLFGKVRYGKATMVSSVPSSPPQRHEVLVVIKEYERDLVERRMTRSGQQVGEDAKEELRLHSLLSRTDHRNFEDPPSRAPQTWHVAAADFPAMTEEPAPRLTSDTFSPSSASSSSPLHSGHPNVVHLYDVRRDEQAYYAILEYCSGGEFFPLVQLDTFTPAHARGYFRQLMLGLQFMHRCQVAHRDLSLENILLDDEKRLKICDFGVAYQPLTKGATLDSFVVDERVPVGKVKFYCPPEVLARQPYSPSKVDTWTAGIILFVMLTKIHPFQYATPADPRFLTVLEGRADSLLIKWGRAPLHPVASDLIRHLLCPMGQRYVVQDCLNHYFCREGEVVIVQPTLHAESYNHEHEAIMQRHHSTPSSSSYSNVYSTQDLFAMQQEESMSSYAT